MSRTLKRTAVALAGIMAAGSSWSVAALAQSQSNTGQEQQQPLGDQQNDQQKQKETGAYGGGMQAGQLDSASRDFLDKTAQNVTGELQLARLAEQKATNPAIQQYAKDVISDHEQLNSQLQQFASKHNVQLPTTPSSDLRTKVSDLQKLSGNNFDKQFLNTMVQQNEKNVNSFVKIAEQENVNPQLQLWAVQSVPKIGTHLVEGRSIQKQIEGGASSGQQGGGMQQGGSQQQKPSTGGSGGY